MINYLQKWIDQLGWQRQRLFEKPAETLLKHVDSLANYRPGDNAGLSNSRSGVLADGPLSEQPTV